MYTVRRKHGRRGRPRFAAPMGFTLIELLVVIAIIALLMSILMPALGRAKAMAKMLKCTTNLRALGQASGLYAADNDGFVPRDYYHGANNPPGGGNHGHYFFASRLSNYIGGPYIDPYYDDPNNGAVPDGATGMSFDEAQEYMAEIFRKMDGLHCPELTLDVHTVHYVSSGFNFRRPWNSKGVTRLSDIPGNTADIVYFAEANLEKLDPTWFGYHDFFHPDHIPFNLDDQVSDGPRMISALDMRHHGQTTVAYFDGHAETAELAVEELSVREFVPPVTLRMLEEED